MDARFIEQLELRQFLSVVSELPILQEASPAALFGAITLAVKYPKIVGTWKGYAKSDGERLSLTFKVTSQKADRFAARMTSRDIPSLSIKVTGRFKSKTIVKFTYKGSDEDGSFKGAGSGTLSNKATKLSATVAHTYTGGDRVKATFVVKR